MALLEGTGWYKMDFTKADTLEWGNSATCDFLENSCEDPSKYEEFCEVKGLWGCSKNGN